MSACVEARSAVQDARVMVEDVIGAEIGSSNMERKSNPSASGGVASHPFALRTSDTTWTVPDVLPLGSVAWPEALLTLWRGMNYSSLLGIFPALSRVWFTVDNKLVLWDFCGRREFCVYDEIPELIIAVGVPVRPRGGVFQPHVTYLLPVATANILFLLGLCVVNEGERAELKIVNLGYSATTDVLLTKIVGLPSVGRVFCAGADGCVYEVAYTRESTPLVPKIRLVCYSYYFSSQPVIGQIASMVNNVRQTWLGSKAGIRDIVVDESREMLLTLDERNKIRVWRIMYEGLRMLRSHNHQPATAMRGDYRDRRESYPLTRLFVVDPDQEGTTLVAVAQNGDLFRYRYVSPLAGDRHIDLVMRGYTPSPFPANREVGVCFAANSTVLLANSEADNEAASDDLVVITSPKAILEPHSSCRDVVASFAESSSRTVRVDAIEKLPDEGRRSPNDLCAQVCSPPTRFVVAHRHGISTYVQLRPVDTLYLIMSEADASCKEQLLQRFAAVYSATDYTAMLIQIAIGAVHGGCAGDLARATSRSGSGAAAASILSAPAVAAPHGERGEAVPLGELGRRLLIGDSVEARRLSQALLRSAAMPVTQAGAGLPNGGYQVTVLMSPLCTGLVAFIARALYGVWEAALEALSGEELGAMETTLSLLLRLIESLDANAARDMQGVALDYPVQWQRNRVVVTLPPGGSLPLGEVRKIQAVMLSGCYQVASKALQTIVFVRNARFIPFAPEERRTTFAQVVRDQDTALRLGGYVSQVILSAQQGIESSSGDRLRVFTQLQQQCPYFFSNVDVQEFRARTEIENLTRGESIGSFSASRMAQWVASVAPNAAAYWTSGSLPGICRQLCDLKREEVAVQLLLHAAAQLDPTGEAFTVYLTERSGQSARGPGAGAAASVGGYDACQAKVRVLELVVAILESAWFSHRGAVDSLLGGPRLSGTIWLVEPSDEMSHCFLFDWLSAPREDATISQTLRDTLVAVHSPHLEKYLTRNSAHLGEEYAHYLRRTKGDYAGAIEQSVLLAQSALPSVPAAERLPYRLRCLQEAYESAKECGSDQAPQVEQRLRLMEAQSRLFRVVSDFLDSGLPQLGKQWVVGGQHLTEREIASQHLEILASGVASSGDLLQMAGMYPTYGGAEVQLDVLVSSNVSDPSTLALCVARAYETQTSSVEETTRRLIQRYYLPTLSFPISFVVRVLEAMEFRKAPGGSRAVVDLLVSCNVDVKVLFRAYQDILEDRDNLDVACPPFEAARVSKAYLIHSISVVLLYMATAARRGAVQSVMVSNATSVVQNYLAQAIETASGSTSERAALDGASEMLRRCDGLVQQQQQQQGFDY